MARESIYCCGLVLRRVQLVGLDEVILYNLDLRVSGIASISIDLVSLCFLISSVLNRLDLREVVLPPY
jgi:hypothetical protein